MWKINEKIGGDEVVVSRKSISLLTYWATIFYINQLPKKQSRFDVVTHRSGFY